jgi:hypothetical protein
MLPSLIGVIASSGGAAAAAGDYESIATVTVGSGGSSSISFTSIPSTYQHLQIRALATNGVQDDAAIRLNGDTGNNYSLHLLVGNGSAAQSFAVTSTSAMRGVCLLSPTANVFGGGVTDILDYTNTNKNTTIRALTGMDNNAGSTVSQVQFWSGAWYNTAAVTSINIFPLGGTSFSQYSSFALYGIKG